MKAVVFHEHGGPEVLRLEEVETPKPGPGEVLVAVRACALNRLDLWTRGGIPGRKIDLPRILGSDVAGEVAEVGAGVGHVKAGDRVAVHAVLSCGECAHCQSGAENLCSRFGILGAAADGGYAEYVKVSGRNVLPIPGGLPFDDASTAPIVFVTAWRMLVVKGGLRAGEEVLVLAAGSGVGTASIQIAKLCGCRVFAAAGRDETLVKARGVGADEVINYTSASLDEALLDLTGGRGVDMVVETVGKDTLAKSLASLKKGGRIVICGTTSGPQVELDYRALYFANKSIVGSTLGTREDHRTGLGLLAAGRLRATLDRTFPLEQAGEAQRVLMNRAQFGKLILHP
ncbi:MAG: zinc-binding dehydrogenase [Nitrospinota bacterium]